MVSSSQGSTKKLKRVSMQTIAKKAGVSTTTVSLALRDHDSISEATKQRILHIQESLGYTFQGRRARSSHSLRPHLEEIIYRTVGMDMREENYMPFLEGIVEECRRRCIKLELDSVSQSDVSAMAAVPSGGVPRRGMIISGRVTDKDVQEVAHLGLPYLVLGNYRLSPPCHIVGVNLLEIAERSMRDLVGEGMQKIIFVVELQARPYEFRFLSYLRNALSFLGMPAENITIFETGLEFVDIETVADQVAALFEPNMRIVTLEKHCAQALTHTLYIRGHKSISRQNIISFLTSTSRFALQNFRGIDLGVKLAGSLAVIRLMDLQRSPHMPINVSQVYSPGWL